MIGFATVGSHASITASQTSKAYSTSVNRKLESIPIVPPSGSSGRSFLTKETPSTAIFLISSLTFQGYPSLQRGGGIVDMNNCFFALVNSRNFYELNAHVPGKTCRANYPHQIVLNQFAGKIKSVWAAEGIQSQFV